MPPALIDVFCPHHFALSTRIHRNRPESLPISNNTRSRIASISSQPSLPKLTFRSYLHLLIHRLRPFLSPPRHNSTARCSFYARSWGTQCPQFGSTRPRALKRYFSNLEFHFPRCSVTVRAEKRMRRDAFGVWRCHEVVARLSSHRSEILSRHRWTRNSCGAISTPSLAPWHPFERQLQRIIASCILPHRVRLASDRLGMFTVSHK